MTDQYRIRWARVAGERACIAERRAWIGWWPVTAARWHLSEAQALQDIEAEKDLRAPLPPNRRIE